MVKDNSFCTVNKQIALISGLVMLKRDILTGRVRSCTLLLFFTDGKTVGSEIKTGYLHFFSKAQSELVSKPPRCIL